MKFIKSTIAILLVLATCAAPAAFAADETGSTIRRGKPVENIYKPVTDSIMVNSMAASSDVWTYSSTVEFDVIGEEVERVNGSSRLTNSSGTDLNHYSRAFFQMPLIGTIKNDTGYKWGYGNVPAITDWLSSFTALAYTGKFYYGS